MNQQPDKFFHEKLHGYQKPVSPGAWSKVAGNLEKKRRGVIWMRAAAAVALLATVGILLYPRTPEPASLIAGSKTSEQRPETSPPDPRDTATDRQPIAHEKHDSSVVIPDEIPAHSQSVKPRIRVPKEPPVNPAVHEPKIAEAVEETTETTPLPVVADNAVAIMEEKTADAIDNNESPQNVTIIFTTEEVNEKYLAKNTDAEATPTSEETSGLRKLLDKAYDLKTNRDFLGELRQKKNEILAMNFKNDKHTQND